jgi:hypothetical protein
VRRVGASGEGDLERVEEVGEGVLSDFNSVGEDAGVDAFRGIALGLLEELACGLSSVSEAPRCCREAVDAPTRRTTLVVPSPVISS